MLFLVSGTTSLLAYLFEIARYSVSSHEKIAAGLARITDAFLLCQALNFFFGLYLIMQVR